MNVSLRADLAAYDPTGQLTLIVEVKGRTDRTRSWAMQVRRNMIEHSALPNTRFFLLAMPDRLYLWKDAGNTPEMVEPTYEIDAAPFFQPYFDSAMSSPGQLTHESFELIVTSWLHELVNWGIPSGMPGAKELQESGLLEAIKGGSVAVEVSV